MKFLCILIFLFSSLARATDCRGLLRTTFPMRAIYQEEEIALNKRTSPGRSARPSYAVKYYSELEKAAYKVTWESEQIHIGGKPFVCSVPFFGCSLLYIVDLDGQIYARAHADNIHHSSFNGGQEVRAVGHLTIKNGRIVYFDNWSGHYTPHVSSNAVMLNAMMLLGMPKPLKIGFVLNPFARFWGHIVTVKTNPLPAEQQNVDREVLPALHAILNSGGVRWPHLSVESFDEDVEAMLAHPDIRAAYLLLDKVFREGWKRRGIPDAIGETVLAHSKKLARAAALFPAKSRGLNHLRMVLMAHIHDIAEYKVPDYTPSDKISADEKHELERQAIRAITENAGEAGKLVMELWEEYNAKQTPEAQIISQLDKLDAAVQAFEYQRWGYNTQEFFPYTQSKLTDPLLKRVFQQLLQSQTPRENYYDQYFRMLESAN